MGSSEVAEFIGHRLQTSMTCATAEDNTAGLGQPHRTGCPLVGGFTFHGVSGLCMSSLAQRLPRSVWDTAADASLVSGSGVGQRLVTRTLVREAAKTRLIAHLHTQQKRQVTGEVSLSSSDDELIERVG